MRFQPSLSQKFALPNLMIFSILSGFFIYLFMSLQNESNLLLKSAAESQLIQDHLIKINGFFAEIEQIVLSSRFTHKDLGLSEASKFRIKIHDNLDSLEPIITSFHGKHLLQDIRQLFLISIDHETELTHAIRRHDENGLLLAFQKWTLSAEQIDSILNDFNVFNIKRLMNEFEMIRTRRIRFGLSLAFVMALFGLFIAFVSWKFYQFFIRPIETLTVAAAKITEEKKPFQVPLDQRNDEIGYLTRAFNEMTSSLIQANSALTELITSRDQFISIASHELKTPLTTLSLQIQLLNTLLSPTEKTIKISQKIREGVSIAQKQTERVIRLVNELLDITRIQAGKLELHPEKINLSTLILEVIDKMSHDLEAASCLINLHLDSLTVGYWDPSRLEQVVVNLLSNAMKYACPSRIEISTQLRGEDALITVRDYGPGIPKEKQAHLFEKFERATEKTSTAQGLGLGLYITKHIIEAHRGSIELQSEPGMGTKFIIRLPTQPVTF